MAIFVFASDNYYYLFRIRSIVNAGLLKLDYDQYDARNILRAAKKTSFVAHKKISNIMLREQGKEEGTGENDEKGDQVSPKQKLLPEQERKSRDFKQALLAIPSTLDLNGSNEYEDHTVAAPEDSGLFDIPGLRLRRTY